MVFISFNIDDMSALISSMRGLADAIDVVRQRINFPVHAIPTRFPRSRSSRHLPPSAA